jgi:hypothetical protein
MLLRLPQKAAGLLQPVQHSGVPVCPGRSVWIGGHGTEPYEQNTQQSPAFGRSVTPQPVQM